MVLSAFVEDVWKSVKECVTCQQYKSFNTKPAGLLQQTKVQQPGEMIGVDFMGHLPLSHSRNTMLMVVVDYYSKWVELFPLKDAKAPWVCQILRDDIFTRWGVPAHIVSDQGPQWTSDTNLTERVNHTMKAMIASFVGKHHQDWNRWLPEFHLAINTAIHESTGVLLAVPALGRSIKGPLEHLIHRAPTPPMVAYNALQNHMALLSEVERHVGVARSRQARYYNVHCRCVQFTVGDLVWIRTHPLSDASAKFSAKFVPRWKGPTKVEKQLGPNNYRVRWGTEKMKVDNQIVDLKPYYGPSVPLAGVGGCL
uniref:Integrase catalytic domain-containing protein n=1 Tax=Pygocentrus nattereri TaxID=42514 RepID=A0AAR2JKP5_PYGNA